MYFNSKKNDTNIDKDFNDNKSFFHKFKFFIIIGIFFVILLFGGIFLFNTGNKVKSYVVLSGDDFITLYQGNDYVEPGYEAYDNNNNILTSEVIIDSNLNINEPGEYEITYTLGNIKKTRKIKIIPKEEGENYTFIYLNTINNDVNVYLKVGDKYNEPGFKVFNNSGIDFNDSVKIVSNVDTSKKGVYKVIYSIVDQNDVTVTASRNVIVMDIDIKLSSKYTDGKVYINVVVNDEYFSHLILPDGTKITNNTYTFTVNKIGNYTFTAYNKKDMSKQASINITSLDKTPPKINSCTVIVKDNQTTFTIKSNDNDIAKYIINNDSTLTYTSNSFTVKRVIKDAKVYVYDKDNNYSISSCSYSYVESPSKPTPSVPSTPTTPSTQVYEQIKPSGKENIKYNESSDTLKVWVEKVTRKNRIDFHVTHIWVKDPYKQFKSQVPDNYGKELLTAGTLFNNAIKQQGLKNKLAVAVNASGFVLKGVWGDSLYKVNPKFNRTAVHPMVISNGEIIRDLTDEKIPKSLNPIYGINGDGMLTYYSFSGADTNAKKKEIYKKIIDDGVLNTFTFSPILVKDGKVNSTKTDKNTRQGFCQINKNNFVFITDIYDDNGRYTGFSFKELAEYMVNLGCKTGFNLDGGGSTNLYIKQKNKTSATTISKTSRQIADIIYFHE